jgi:hypothetical protein
MKRLAWLLREPLLHFLAIGGLIFMSFGAVATPGPGSSEIIVVGLEQVARLAARYQSVWQRPPTEDERRAMIDDFVREEIYYREALALGLDRNDVVVRRRLRQKMEFLTDTAADILEPTEGELEAYFAANRQTYGSEPQLAFEQIYLGENPVSDSITLTLSALRSDRVTDPSTFGKSTLLPAQLDLSPPNAIDGVFGQGFFERLPELPPGKWVGPVDSAYGVHLVRILDSSPARAPTLEDVRGAVLRDWKAAKALEIRERHYAQLRERYVVEIQGADVLTVENR